MHNPDFTQILDHFPEHIQEKCVQAFRQGQEQMSGETPGLSEKEVIEDERRKAEWTYNRQHD